MGVKQLWKELEARGALRKLAGGSHHAELAAELEGKVVAIDLAIWAAQCSDQVYASQELNHAQKAAKLALERATMLLQYGVVPLGVVEGVPPALKAAAIERRNAAFYGAESASRGGAHTGMKSITRGMGKVFRALGLPVVEAPSEAEAMCCALVEVGLADAVATEDGDALIYKAKKCYRYLKCYPDKPETSTVGVIEREGDASYLPALGIPQHGHGAGIPDKTQRNLLAWLAAIVGHEYQPAGVPKMGPKKTIKLLAQIRAGLETPALGEDGEKALEKLGALVHENNLGEVTEEFEEQWRLALARAEELPRANIVWTWRRPSPLALANCNLPWSPDFCSQKLRKAMVAWDLQHPGDAQAVFRLTGVKPLPARKNAKLRKPWWEWVHEVTVQGGGLDAEGLQVFVRRALVPPALVPEPEQPKAKAKGKGKGKARRQKPLEKGQQTLDALGFNRVVGRQALAGPSADRASQAAAGGSPKRPLRDETRGAGGAEPPGGAPGGSPAKRRGRPAHCDAAEDEVIDLTSPEQQAGHASPSGEAAPLAKLVGLRNRPELNGKHVEVICRTEGRDGALCFRVRLRFDDGAGLDMKVKAANLQLPEHANPLSAAAAVIDLDTP